VDERSGASKHKTTLKIKPLKFLRRNTCGTESLATFSTNNKEKLQVRKSLKEILQLTIIIDKM
jgi:hypothetical protein